MSSKENAMKAVNLGIACLSALFALSAHAADQAPVKKVNGVLVDAHGMTVYTFDKDVAGSGKSACNGPCAKLWPPLMANAGDQPSGDWSIVAREDGMRQWAYKGKPLYHYQEDEKAGQRGGDNFKKVWHIIKG
jgi:predicted lipoprotein with Yx(FWY)xxD motif